MPPRLRLPRPPQHPPPHLSRPPRPGPPQINARKKLHRELLEKLNSNVENIDDLEELGETGSLIALGKAGRLAQTVTDSQSEGSDRTLDLPPEDRAPVPEIVEDKSTGNFMLSDSVDADADDAPPGSPKAIGRSMFWEDAAAPAEAGPRVGSQADPAVERPKGKPVPNVRPAGSPAPPPSPAPVAVAPAPSPVPPKPRTPAPPPAASASFQGYKPQTFATPAPRPRTSSPAPPPAASAPARASPSPAPPAAAPTRSGGLLGSISPPGAGLMDSIGGALTSIGDAITGSPGKNKGKGRGGASASAPAAEQATPRELVFRSQDDVPDVDDQARDLASGPSSWDHEANASLGYPYAEVEEQTNALGDPIAEEEVDGGMLVVDEDAYFFDDVLGAQTVSKGLTAPQPPQPPQPPQAPSPPPPPPPAARAPQVPPYQQAAPQPPPVAPPPPGGGAQRMSLDEVMSMTSGSYQAQPLPPSLGGPSVTAVPTSAWDPFQDARQGQAPPAPQAPPANLPPPAAYAPPAPAAYAPPAPAAYAPPAPAAPAPPAPAAPKPMTYAPVTEQWIPDVAKPPGAPRNGGPPPAPRAAAPAAPPAPARAPTPPGAPSPAPMELIAPPAVSSAPPSRHSGQPQGILGEQAGLDVKLDVNEIPGWISGSAKCTEENVMSLVFVGSECAPWAKTGGLGDVMQALPKAMAARGHRVMVIMPRYGNRDYEGADYTGRNGKFNVFGQIHEVGYHKLHKDGVDWVFVDHPTYAHMGKDIYAGGREEQQFRCAMLCKAALEAPWIVPYGKKGENPLGEESLVFVANDWHTALLPFYLQAHYRDHGKYAYARSAFVLHNMAHQGRGPLDERYNLEIPEHYLEQFRFYDPVGGEHMNLMKVGLEFTQKIIAVSRGYAWETQTPEGGWGLHEIMQRQESKLHGVVNGIDLSEWSPEVDHFLEKKDGYANYSIKNFRAGKRACKLALQKELGLPQDPDAPVLGFIGRLDYQKGVDLIRDSFPWLMEQGVQLVLLGSGREDLETDLRNMENQAPGQCKAWVGFSVAMAHRMTAGCDILLMPSRFEPCGLNQLYAMRYGTIPVVHAVGGLRDTVEPFDPFADGGSGTGWRFDSVDGEQFRSAVYNAVDTFRNYRESFEGIQMRGMEQDLSWGNAAHHYEDILLDARNTW